MNGSRGDTILASSGETIGAVTKKLETMPSHEIDAMMRRLNHEQRLFVHHVLRLTELDRRGQQIFLTGGPGVGKSHVLKTIRAGLDDIYGRDHGEWKCRFVQCAYTGSDKEKCICYDKAKRNPHHRGVI